MATPELWSKLVEQPVPGEAIVGLKGPGARRGTWRGKLLLSPRELQGAQEVLRKTPGVDVLRVDEAGAWAVVRIATENALAAVRGLKVFDYMHPRYSKLQLSSNGSSGCDHVPYEESNHQGLTKELFRVKDVTGNSPLFRDYSDFVPWNFVDLKAMSDRLKYPDGTTMALYDVNFRGHRIPSAWRRVGGGSGVLLGVVDTGVYHDQKEVVPPDYPGSTFNTGMSPNRRMVWEQFTGDLQDSCGHGTRASTTAVAGINDTGPSRTLAGVAWGADFASAQVNDNVALDWWYKWDHVVQGIRFVVCGDASPYCTMLPTDTRHRIVSMAFGITGGAHLDSNVAHEIERWSEATPDHQAALFLGASGTDFCNDWPGAPLFPANHPDVLAVSCIDPRTGQRTHMDLDLACQSGPLGVAGVWGPDVPTGGQFEGDIWAFGGSSACVTTVAGIAALVWSAHPELTWRDVQTRLRQAGHLSTPSDEIGYGVVDAVVATGGLGGTAQLSGDSTALPGATFHIRQTHKGGQGSVVRYEWTDASCNGQCRWNGSTCTGSCPLVGSCPAGQVRPYCSEVTRTASGVIGGEVKTKVTLFDESSQDQSDDVAMISSTTHSNCASRTCTGRCGVIAGGCGTNLNCGSCAGWYGLDVSFDVSYDASVAADPTRDPTSPRQMVSFAITSGLPRVYSVTALGHVRELAWNGTVWKALDLTTKTGAPSVGGAPLAGFASAGANPRVYFLTSDGSVQELAWNGSWSTLNLTTLTHAPAAALSSLEAFAVGGSLSRVYYIGATDAQVHELAWNGSSWSHSKITVPAPGAPTAVAGSALSGFALSGNNPRVYYVSSTNNHVIELAWNNGWGALDISGWANPVVPAAANTTLNSYAINGTLTRVHYLDDASRVRELAWTGSAWQQTFVTGATAPREAVPGSALAGFALNGSDVRIYYVSPDNNHVHELSWSNGWYDLDIAGRTGAPATTASSPLTGFALNGTSPRLYSLSYNTGSKLVVRELAWY